MNIRLSLILIVLSLSILPITAHSQEGANQYYVSGNFGITFPRDSTTTDSTVPGTTLDFGYDNGWSFIGAFGAKRDQYRADFEFGFQTNDLDSVKAMGTTLPLAGTGIKGHVDVVTGLVNVYYDFDLNNGFVPYLTAGLGFANATAKITVPGYGTVSDDDTVFAYQAGAGIGYVLNDRITLDARYRYLGTSDSNFGTTKSEFASHNILLGVRVNF